MREEPLGVGGNMDLLLRSLGFSDGGVEKQRSGECEAGRDARQKGWTFATDALLVAQD